MATNRMGQNSAGGAAGFIAVIAGALLLYILLLPPDVRDELLDENGVTPPDNGVLPDDDILNGINRTLLDESPGRLSYQRFDEYEHNFPSINLFSTTSGKQREIGNALYIKSGIFDRKEEFVEFEMPKRDLVENIYLYFDLNRNRNNKGELIIWLNDKRIFRGEVGDSLSDPISVNKDDIRESNVLGLEVSGVGWKFWTTNEYEVNNLRVFYDEMDKSRQEGSNSFIIRDSEIQNMDMAKLEFNADCNPREAEVLEVSLNRHTIYSSVPDCGSMNRVDVSKDVLRAGENTITFRGTKGDFLITNSRLRTEMKEIAYPVYYFEVDDRLFDTKENKSVLDDRYDVWLNFRFIDDGERKTARVFINGNQFYLDTNGGDYKRKINHYVEEGTNAIKIEPDLSVLNIIKLQAEVEERK